MDHLPLSDIPMLVSSINFLLRDKEFDTLDEICDHFELQRTELETRLREHGYEFNEQYNKFI